MKKLIIMSFSMFLAIITSALSKDFEINDVEKIGFQKDSQQFYQMIGAIDGWSGTLGGESVEVYFFENKKKINDPFFKSLVPGDSWKDYCKKNNVALISKGKNACKLLKKLK
tara:strand:+ start:705 stop:1040 length:336 start_codon:yes stop_codon:yes gene_type:complete